MKCFAVFLNRLYKVLRSNINKKLNKRYQLIEKTLIIYFGDIKSRSSNITRQCFYSKCFIKIKFADIQFILLTHNIEKYILLVKNCQFFMLCNFYYVTK